MLDGKHQFVRTVTDFERDLMVGATIEGVARAKVFRAVVYSATSGSTVYNFVLFAPRPGLNDSMTEAEKYLLSVELPDAAR